MWQLREVLFMAEADQISRGEKAKFGLRLNCTTLQFDCREDWIDGEFSSILTLTADPRRPRVAVSTRNEVGAAVVE